LNKKGRAYQRFILGNSAIRPWRTRRFPPSSRRVWLFRVSQFYKFIYQKILYMSSKQSLFRISSVNTVLPSLCEITLDFMENLFHFLICKKGPSYFYNLIYSFINFLATELLGNKKHKKCIRVVEIAASTRPILLVSVIRRRHFMDNRSILRDPKSIGSGKTFPTWREVFWTLWNNFSTF